MSTSKTPFINNDNIVLKNHILFKNLSTILRSMRVRCHKTNCIILLQNICFILLLLCLCAEKPNRNRPEFLRPNRHSSRPIALYNIVSGGDRLRADVRTQVQGGIVTIVCVRIRDPRVTKKGTNFNKIKTDHNNGNLTVMCPVAFFLLFRFVRWRISRLTLRHANHIRYLYY